MRNGGHVRSIGFRKEHAERSILHDFVVIMREREHSGEREREAKIEKFLRRRPVPCKEMHIPFYFRMRFQDFERIIIRILALRILGGGGSDVEHQRFFQVVRKLNVLDEHIFLQLLRAFVATVVIESTLSYRDDAGILTESFVNFRLKDLPARGESASWRTYLLTSFFRIVLRLRGVYR